MRRILFAASLVLASHSAVAAYDPNSPAVMSNFNYDYVEARIGIDPITFGGAYSTSIHPNAHAIVKLDSKLEGDYNLSAGFGFHAPVNNWADITGEMLFRAVDQKNSGSDAGMEINLGVRQWLGPQLELGGNISYLDVGNNDNVGGLVYSRFHATELFSIGLEGKINHFYGDQLMVTTRFKL